MQNHVKGLAKKINIVFDFPLSQLSQCQIKTAADEKHENTGEHKNTDLI